MASRRTDYLKPAILVQAGIVAASVAILVALITGTASKENDLYRPIFAQTMAPMAVTVLWSTISVGVLQVLRFLWQMAPDTNPNSNKWFWDFRPWIGRFFRTCALIVFIASICLTVMPGVDAEIGRAHV